MITRQKKKKKILTLQTITIWKKVYKNDLFSLTFGYNLMSNTTSFYIAQKL